MAIAMGLLFVASLACTNMVVQPLRPTQTWRAKLEPHMERSLQHLTREPSLRHMGVGMDSGGP